MSQTLSPSSARCYGLARVAHVWTVSRASVYRSLKETPPNTIARRPGPVGACSDAELADHIRRQIAASRLHGEGYRKLWARLRFAGVRASPRRVRRGDGRESLDEAFPTEIASLRGIPVLVTEPDVEKVAAPCHYGGPEALTP